MIRVGNSSVSTSIEAIVTLDETVITLKAKNCLGKPDFTDCKLREKKAEVISEEVAGISVLAKDIAKEEVNYDVSETWKADKWSLQI